MAQPTSADTEGALRRIDSYPYRHRIRDIMRAPPQFIREDRPIREALTRMTDARISSLYVGAAAEGPVRADDAGIVTERDLLRALAQHGGAALDLPVGQVMNRPLVSVPAEAFVYRAIGLMNRLRIRHLGVVDEMGGVVGALSARDLLRLRAGEAVMLGSEIDLADDAGTLAAAWSKLPQVAAALLAETVPVRDIAAVISRELGAVTRRAAVIAQARMRAEGRGDPPCPYAIAVLGSAGRDESLLAMDQDNALFFAQGAPDGAEDRWFAALAAHVADTLNQAGIPYCKGGVMAKNAPWRGSVATWRTRIGGWILRSNPQDLLSVDIFFDLRGVHGELAMANGLRQEAFDAAQGQAAFAKLLAEAAGAIEPGLTFMRGFRTEEGRINLKKSGSFGIVTATRALAVCHHVTARSTPARIDGIKALGIGGQRDLDALAGAHGVFLELILAQQIEDLAQGLPASNAVAVKDLSQADQARLRHALRAVEQLDELLRDLLFRG